MIQKMRRLVLQRIITVSIKRLDPRTRAKRIDKIIDKNQLAYRQTLAAIVSRRQNQIHNGRLQLQLNMQKLAQLEALEQFDLFLRQIQLQGIIIVTGKLQKMKDLAGQSKEMLARKMSDADDETRWMAIQIVSAKRYHLEGALLKRLGDAKSAVRQAARQALIRLSRGNDFGPTTEATSKERARAVDKWKRWWSLQDSNPRRRIVPVAERP
jgi:hypothetical protein